MSALTPKQRKTFVKITEVLGAHPFGATLQDIYNDSLLSITVIKNALEKMDGIEQRGDSWFLKNESDTPATHEIAENMQDIPVNMQDDELNTQALHVSSPDNGEATLINPSAETFNPSAEVVNPSDINTDADQCNGQAIETAPVAESEEEFEIQPPPVHQKHFILIENCYLSLAQDGTGQEPVLAKDIWVDDEGDELEECDCQVMKRARESYSNEVDFRGVTYSNLFIVDNAQIFHGVFDSIKAAHDKMAELTTKKRGNFFEVIEV